MSKYCPKCGTLVSENAKFCRYCGNKLLTTPSTTVFSSDSKTSNNNDLNDQDQNETGVSGSNIKKYIIVLLLLLTTILFCISVKYVINTNNLHSSDDHSMIGQLFNGRTETNNKKQIKIEVSEYLNDISLYEDSIGAHLDKVDSYGVYYTTDYSDINIVAEKEGSPVIMLWFKSNKYSLFDVFVGMEMEEAETMLLEHGWNYSEMSEMYEKNNYSVQLLPDTDKKGDNAHVGEVFFIDFTKMSTDFVDDSEVLEIPIGSLTVNVDELRKRNGPSLSADYSGSTVNTGEFYEVFEMAYADGYTWYRIGIDVWIASDGSYVTYKSY